MIMKQDVNSHNVFTPPELPGSLFSVMMGWYVCFGESDERTRFNVCVQQINN